MVSKIILATSNKGKIKEFKEYMRDFEVLSYGEVMDEFEIEESGKTFKENALIKARVIFEKLKDKDVIVISDDSGISVPLLDNNPGIYSARYAGLPSNANKNLELLVENLKEKNVQTTPAFYTACIGLVTKHGEFSVHGWMHGYATTMPKGNNGFGYDPMFIPEGFDKTLGELDDEIKEKFSHRIKALNLAKILLKTLK
ncbi:MAG: RdgB/HAM1 family non-canonical purine NTP pyrophosphatase [Campylobacteraceae bacterium]|nr:RdgB/HAM1 family non-canonical purine NTP pyrophosphatase [Campylobacteraceae bacterium]